MKPKRTTARRRRTPTEAKRHILDAAESLLLAGGPQVVQVRAVAREAGMTDAGVAHHFGDRDGLLSALLDHGASKLRRGIEEAIDSWRDAGTDIDGLIEALGSIYGAGYAQLAMQLHSAGWRDRGSPLLEPVVDALRTACGADVAVDDIRLTLASLNHWLATDPLFGEEFRRSAGLRGAGAAKRQRTWWVSTVKRCLALQD
jgi:TetR/AcrR family transcriptional regulator, repressor for neighboring sulfatase